MIPYTSCMCFNAGRRPRREWSIVPSTPHQRQANVQLVRGENDVLCIKIVERREERCRRPVTLSRSEWYLLQSIDLAMGRQLVTDPFLTPQRRRIRQRVPVIKPEALKSELLDDAYSEIIKCMLGSCGRWAFNTFNLDVATGGRSLSTLLVHLFQQYRFTDCFQLDIVKVWRCFNLIESCYHSTNPYHNSVHAADVTQAMHCFLQESKISAYITPLEAMSALIAAVTHDLDHPGVNQPFLIATSNHLAALYKNFSVLENHHWRMAISCLRESGLFDHLDKDTWDQVESYIHSLILATDITRQQEFLSNFKGYLDSGMLQMENPVYRHFILQIALKCADLCNPCRPWSISEKWSRQVCLEFYKQGDFERKLQLPVTPICDRYKTTVAKIQADFFRFVVTPLFDIWDRFLQTPLSKQLTINLQHNQAHWDAQVQIIPAALPEPPPTEEEEEEAREELKEPCLLSWARRCSMPVSIPNLLPRTTIRRQSFPHTQKSSYFTSLPLHRSPHLSLRTLSAEQLQPKTSILSLSGGKVVFGSVIGVLGGGAERRLVHQPASFPPFSRRDEPSLPIDFLLKDASPPEEGASPLEDSAQSSAETEVTPPSDAACRTVEEVEEDAETGSHCSNGCCSTPRGSGGDEALCCHSSSLQMSNAQIPSSSEIRGQSPNKDVTDLSPSVLEQLLREAAGEGGPQKPRTLTRLKSENDMYEIKNVPEEESGPESPLLKQVSSWCSHISHSLSEERPEPPSRDFDSPSWKSSSSSLSGSSRLISRRGSAPVTLTGGPLDAGSELRPSLRGGSAGFSRRWSLATEPMSGLSLDPEKAERPQLLPNPFAICPLRRELVRRHSFGILESLVGIVSSESENEGSSTDPTSTGTTCSTRRNSTLCRQELTQRQSISSRGTTDTGDQEGSCSSESHDVFPPSARPSTRPLPGRRRGSLPADIPISLVHRISAFSTTEVEPNVVGSEAGMGWGEHAGRRRTSAGDILNALVGPSVALAALQEFSAGRGTSPAAAAVDPSLTLPRRSLGSLEMFAGIWRSRDLTGSQQSLVSAASRFKFMDSVDRGSREFLVRCPLANQSGASSGFSALSDHLLCQRRRGSVPIDLSLLPVSSGNASNGDPDK